MSQFENEQTKFYREAPASHFASFPRKREGGFTFEVQRHSRKYLSRGFEAKAFSWSVVMAIGDGLQGVAGKAGKAGFGTGAVAALPA